MLEEIQQQEIEEIEEAFLDSEDNYEHHKHPTNPDINFCGSLRPPNRTAYINQRCGRVTCPICNAIKEHYWEIHCSFYNSQCHAQDGYVFHNCLPK